MNKSFETSSLSALLVAASVLVWGGPMAQDVKVKLIGAEETPPVATTATGTGTSAGRVDEYSSPRRPSPIRSSDATVSVVSA